MKDELNVRFTIATVGFLTGMFLTALIWSKQVITYPSKCNVVSDGALVVLVCVKEPHK